MTTAGSRRWLGALVLLLGACGGDDGAASSATEEATGSTSTSTLSTASGTTRGADETSSGPVSTGTSPGSTSEGSGSEEGSSTTTGVAGGCSDTTLLVCEDFEGAPLGGYPEGWDLRSSGVWGGNTMGVSDEQAVSGTQALRVASGQTGAQWLSYGGDLSALASGYWGRMRFRMGPAVPWPAGGVIHGDLFEARGSWNDSTHQVRWAVINNSAMQHNWGYNVQTSNAGEFIYETSYTYTWTEDWLCIEWHHDQAAQAATLWVDGEQLLDVVAAQDPQLPAFDDISVGWANYQPADPEFIVYIDDVAFDDERIGCDG